MHLIAILTHRCKRIWIRSFQERSVTVHMVDAVLANGTVRRPCVFIPRCRGNQAWLWWGAGRSEQSVQGWHESTNSLPTECEHSPSSLSPPHLLHTVGQTLYSNGDCPDVVAKRQVTRVTNLWVKKIDPVLEKCSAVAMWHLSFWTETLLLSFQAYSTRRSRG